MHKAIQELKTRAERKKYVLVGFSLLAAAFGFIGCNSHSSTTVSHEISEKQYESELTIQNGKPTASREQYKVLKGDSLLTISQKSKPRNVELNEYIKVLKSINSGVILKTGTVIEIPTAEDLKAVSLPEIELKIDTRDELIISQLKNAEGTSELQAVLKRSLIGGDVGASFKDGKFYPYRDSTGNYTIGYGHYLGKSERDAIKYRNGISKQQAHNILIADMKRTEGDLILLLQRKRAVDLTIDQQRLLFDMAFTLGIDKLSKFNKMWNSIEANNSHKFKHEILNSRWYKQVGSGRVDLLLSNI